MKVGRNCQGAALELTAVTVRVLRVSDGDAVHLPQTPEGFQLVAHDPDFEESMAVAECFIKRFRNPVRELAK